MNFYIFNANNILIDTITLNESSYSGVLNSRISSLPNALNPQVYINKKFKGTSTHQFYLTSTELYQMQKIYGYQTNPSNKVVILDSFSNVYLQVHAVSDFSNRKVADKDLIDYYIFDLTLEIIGLFSYPPDADYQMFSQKFFIDAANVTAFNSAYTKFPTTISGTHGSIYVENNKLHLLSADNDKYTYIRQILTAYKSYDLTIKINFEMTRDANVGCSYFVITTGDGVSHKAYIYFRTDCLGGIYKYQTVCDFYVSGVKVKQTLSAWTEFYDALLYGTVKIAKIGTTIYLYFDKNNTGTFTLKDSYSDANYNSQPYLIQYSAMQNNTTNVLCKISDISLNPDFIYEV